MDAAFRTPLVDIFRRGEVDREVRLLAAKGALAPRAHEQVALLMLLVDDADSIVAATAEATLGLLPLASVAAFLARSDVGREMREFFARRGIAPAQQPAAACEAPLLDATEPAAAEAGDAGRGAPEAAAPEGEDGEGPRRDAVHRLALLTVAERMKVAMQGTREERGILVRDPNRLVSAAVLSSPKLTESEVEAMARMTNVSDEVLRTIGTTRTWVKNYNVLSALARNPKTPIAISLGLLSRLNERDVKMLSTDRNIPEPVRVASRKMHVHNQTRRQ